jgi:hypothetical protein
MGDAEMQRRRRFLHVTGAFQEVLDATRLARVKPMRFAGGVLTVDVVDGLLLAELKQHFEKRLIDACARHGTGVSRIQWRLARGRR